MDSKLGESTYLLLHPRGSEAAKQPAEIKNISLHSINYRATCILFFKAFAATVIFLSFRIWLRHIGYMGSLPVAGVTAFMAGTYFVLSMILKGVLDEYAESSRLPLELTSNVIHYRELYQLIATQTEVGEVTDILAKMVSKIMEGILTPRSGITTIDQVMMQIEELHCRHVLLKTRRPGDMPILINLTKQIAVIRRLILRADHVARASYLPISQSLSWLLAISSSIVLSGVEYTNLFQEYTLLPCLASFVYLFGLFAEEMDDPFNIYSSISVSMESFQSLHRSLEVHTQTVPR